MNAFVLAVAPPAAPPSSSAPPAGDDDPLLALAGADLFQALIAQAVLASQTQPAEAAVACAPPAPDTASLACELSATPPTDHAEQANPVVPALTAEKTTGMAGPQSAEAAAETVPSAPVTRETQHKLPAPQVGTTPAIRPAAVTSSPTTESVVIECDALGTPRSADWGDGESKLVGVCRPAERQSSEQQHGPRRFGAATLERDSEHPMSLAQAHHAVVAAEAKLKPVSMPPAMRESAAESQEPTLSLPATVSSSPAPESRELLKPVSGVVHTPTLLQVREQMIEQTVSFRRLGLDSLEVVMKPDGQTELALHLTVRDDQVQVDVRLERGDLSGWRGRWPELQQSLAQQGVRLSALNPVSSASVSAGFGGNSGQQPQSGEQPFTEAPWMSDSDRGGRRGPVASRSRRVLARGWERWA